MAGHIFVSHNARDKEQVRTLASALKVAGGEVWFDEWKVRPGDSLPGTISAALEGFGTFLLVWSANAAGSRWVAQEMNAALAAQMARSDVRIVPIILDDTPLPGLLQDRFYLDARIAKPLAIAQLVLGLASERDLRVAVQRTLNDLHLQEFWGVGVLVGCPACGASLDKIQEREWFDDRRGDVYRGAHCLECTWSDASEA